MKRNYPVNSKLFQILAHVQKMCDRRFDANDYDMSGYSRDTVNAYLREIKVYIDRALVVEKEQRIRTKSN